MTTFPLLIDFTDDTGTIESVIADNAVDAYDLIIDKLKHLSAADYRHGFTIKVGSAKEFLAKLDEEETGI